MGMTKFVLSMAEAVPPFVHSRRMRGIDPAEPDLEAYSCRLGMGALQSAATAAGVRAVPAGPAEAGAGAAMGSRCAVGGGG